MPRRRDTRLFPHQAGWPPTWRGRFPRLVPAERALLTAWLDTAGRDVDALWYDVRMDGIPVDVVVASPPELAGDPDLLRNWWQQTTRRCDAIARRGDEYTVIELRALADAQSIGELQIYQRLARTEWPALTWSQPELIAARIRPGALELLDELAIQIHLYPALDLQPSVPLAHLTR